MQVTSTSTRNFDLCPDRWRFESTNAHVATRKRLQHYTVGKPVTSVMSLTGRARSKPRKSLESFDLRHEPSCNERPVTVGGTQGFATIRLSLKATLTIILGISIKGTVIAEHQGANALAYHLDVSAESLLSSAVPRHEWAQPLHQTLSACTKFCGGQWANTSCGPITPLPRC